MKDPRDIILRPIISEKSYSLMDKGTYTFEVHPDSSKPEICDAVVVALEVDDAVLLLVSTTTVTRGLATVAVTSTGAALLSEE